MAVTDVFPQYLKKELSIVDSTNIWVEKALQTTNLPEGSVIYTLNQTAGIGQQSNKWESEPGKNLTLTTVLYPSFLPASEQFNLTIIISLATCWTIDHFLENSETKIKWPNDIYYNNQKLAGILIKNNIIGTTINQTIAGVGLNINQTHFQHAPNAISLKNISGNSFQVYEVLSQWHTLLAEAYKILKDNKHQLMNMYYSRMYLKDIEADYMINSSKIRAVISGVDEYGQLILKDSNRVVHICGIKEVKFPHLKSI